ncbi:quinone-dependent dihydroorotate dehydrogenase [Geothrix sp. 21YS21S-4]|uniref:quinone-dependent dihydroorotate dehydrogenase n=1 Tax=Geothrix sp. 21YS21S-4 TaxID=3068889 RepID=UPI0027B92C34|nr:quinone-dependent dihydroorotate dehydrogenase [Geothrix sp. 21YS21S-4]
MRDLYRALRPLIFRLDPETAHNLAFWLGERACSWPRLPEPEHAPSLRRTAFGLDFPTPLGLAAGLDKGATLLPLWKSLGFGHVEIGTVTPRPQPGNPKPRLFRFPQAGLILNRMGFNSEGAEAVAARLRRRPAGLVVGGNLGKNKETPEALALDDYRAAYRLIAPGVDYIALNVSSPNTPGLRNLQAPAALEPLLAGMLDLRKEMGLERQPLLLKLAPDLAPEDLDAIVEVAAASGISGLIATNTTLDRGVVPEPLRTAVESKGAGGLSGVPLKAKARDVRKRILAALNGRLPLVACGGLGSAEDVRGALNDGAALAQIYSALIFEGPEFVRQIHVGLLERN